MTRHSLSAPVSAPSAQRLSNQGLRMVLLDPSDDQAVGAYYDAVARGFHGSEPRDEERRRFREQVLPLRRAVGVWDPALEGPQPVATLASWDDELSVPGGRAIPTWAISAVTVAPTHHRRGIARALLEGELCTAAALGIPIASLTVSEATLYGRYGFGAAASASSWVIETRRAGWAARVPDARVGFITREDARRELAELHERVRLSRPGELRVWDQLWDQVVGIGVSDEGAARKLRFAAARDADGSVRGVAVYSLDGDERDFTKHTVKVARLDAETDDAAAALWRFLLELDLVATLRADSRPVDDPVRWLIADQRAATETRTDHHWLRILDVVAALEARSWAVDGALALVVHDDLGLAEGSYLLTASGGRGRVERAAVPPDGVPTLEVDASSLSSLYLGGVRAATLVAAGRISELAPGSADAADALLRSPGTPYLSFWY